MSDTSSPARPEPAIDRRIATAAGKLFVREHPGSGPAFVLLHGFPDNLRIYDRLAPLLAAAGRRVVGFDFLGFGASDQPGAGYSFEQQVGDLLAVADALGLEQIVPVAHDAGGPAAINFARLHPGRVAEVALLNSFYAPSPALRFPEFIEVFATPSLGALQRYFLGRPDLFGELLQFQRGEFRAVLGPAEQADWDAFLLPIIQQNFISTPGAGTAFAHLTAQVNAEVERNGQHLGAVGQLDVPFRLVWGAEDPYLGVEVAHDLARNLRDATTTVLAGAGHWPQIDRPADVARALTGLR